MLTEHWLQWLIAYLIVLALLSIGAALHERHQWRKETRMSNDDQDIGTPQWWGVLALLLVLILGALIISGSRWPAHARDLDGRFAASPLKPWFDHLASKKGLCCSFADGYAIEDADWTTKDGHYRVRLPVLQGSSEFEWVDVPDDAVITEPNQAGRTMVWPMYHDGQQTVRCFMPGSMT